MTHATPSDPESTDLHLLRLRRDEPNGAPERARPRAGRRGLGPWLARVAGLALVFALSVGADCDPERAADVALYTTTGAPPTAVARVQEADPDRGLEARVELSSGVVLAVRCWDTCDYTCESPELITGDAAVLGVIEVERVGSRSPEYALVAHRAGTTTLRVRTSCDDKTYAVSVD